MSSSTWKVGGGQRVATARTTALDEPGGPSGFEVDDMLVTVELGGESLALAVTALREQGVVKRHGGWGAGRTVAEASSGGWWGVYSRRLDDRDVALALEGGELVEVGGPHHGAPARAGR